MGGGVIWRVNGIKTTFHSFIRENTKPGTSRIIHYAYVCASGANNMTKKGVLGVKRHLLC